MGIVSQTRRAGKEGGSRQTICTTEGGWVKKEKKKKRMGPPRALESLHVRQRASTCAGDANVGRTRQPASSACRPPSCFGGFCFISICAALEKSSHLDGATSRSRRHRAAVNHHHPPFVSGSARIGGGKEDVHRTRASTEDTVKPDWGGSQGIRAPAASSISISSCSLPVSVSVLSESPLCPLPLFPAW